MKFSTLSILICAVLSAALPCSAQQPSGATPAPAASAPATAPTTAPTAAQTPASSSDPSAPSAETLKRAKSVGLHPETRGGKTQYCWEDASVGSRFTTKKCTDENGLDALIAQREAVKANMRQSMTSSSSH